MKNGEIFATRYAAAIGVLMTAIAAFDRAELGSLFPILLAWGIVLCCVSLLAFFKVASANKALAIVLFILAANTAILARRELFVAIPITVLLVLLPIGFGLLLFRSAFRSNSA